MEDHPKVFVGGFLCAFGSFGPTFFVETLGILGQLGHGDAHYYMYKTRSERLVHEIHNQL